MSKVVEVMAEAAEVAIYGRHARGFIMRPLIDAPDMKTGMEAALAALEAAGFVVVPKEPTPEMRGAGTELLCSGGLVYGQDIDDTVVIETAAARCVYEVMLRAAP